MAMRKINSTFVISSLFGLSEKFHHTNWERLEDVLRIKWNWKLKINEENFLFSLLPSNGFSILDFSLLHNNYSNFLTTIVSMEFSDEFRSTILYFLLLLLRTSKVIAEEKFHFVNELRKKFQGENFLPRAKIICFETAAPRLIDWTTIVLAFLIYL